MRTTLILLVLISSVIVKAQTAFPVSYMDYAQREAFVNRRYFEDSTQHKKWSLSKYVAISTNFSFYNNGSATTMAVPMGLQLSRRLNDNLYAFAGISAAPAYINFNGSFPSPGMNKPSQNNSNLKSPSFGMYSRAEMGLMYINNEKTFSISGSIGIERSNYPIYPYYPINNKPHNTVVAPNR